MDKPYDYFIVGLGLAGTSLAFTLQHKYNKRIFAIDEDAGKTCSSIAAGTFNPIAFRTFKTTWQSQVLVPFLLEFYTEVERNLNVQILNRRSVLKVIKNDDQRKLWKSRSLEAPANSFMSGDLLESREGVKSEFGIGEVHTAGNINMNALLSSFRKELKDNGNILDEKADYAELKWVDNFWRYKNIKAKRVVFCEGHRAIENPLFKDLPFKQTKGEVLFIRCKNLKSKDIIHNNINIVPLENDLYWVGSTFEWNDINTNISQSAKIKLLNQLREVLICEFEILDHKAGIRPTVKDRRPILGEHPDQKSLFIFNGLGARGVMIAPYFANHLAAHIEYGNELDPEVDLQRFTSRG